MASPFVQTLRALEVDRRAMAIRSLLLTLGFLITWASWGIFAQVTIYAQSQAAHVEVMESSWPAHASQEGRLRRIAVALGMEVEEGQVLFVLDTSEAELALKELDAQIAGLEAEREMVEARLSVTRAARLEGDALTQAIKAETRARMAELEVQAELAERQVERSRVLQGSGILDLEQLERDQTEARRLRHATRALNEAQNREIRSAGLDLSDRAATITTFEQELRSLEAAIQTQSVTRQRLERQRSELEVTAPIAGRVGDLTDLRPGSWVQQGQELARVVPRGQVQVVAQVRAADAVGRIRPGQLARVRLDGFPWTQYGTIEAEVTTIAAEAQNGLVRVELAVAAKHEGIGVLEHAMPGQVDVAVEQVPPLALLLRTAGAWLGESAPAETGGVP